MRQLLTLAAVVALALSTAACDDNGEQQTAPPAQQGAPPAQ
jgi:hypothetical protein